MDLRKAVVGIVVGALGGFLWQRLVGCRTGACPLTANPWLSTLYGALLGLMVSTSR